MTERIKLIIDDRRWRDVELYRHERGVGMKRNYSEAEMLLLLDALKRIVPKAEFGDGVEVFEDYIDDAEDADLFEAARLLHIIRDILKPLPPSVEEQMAEAASMARKILQDVGIDYEGATTTYVYNDRRNRTRQISANRVNVVRELERIRRETCTYKSNSSYESRPWHIYLPLSTAHSLGHFGINTLQDHAISLLRSYDNFRASDCCKKKINLAYTIGRYHEALKKKPYERYAIRGKTDFNVRSKGGQATEKADTKQIVAEMREIIESGHTEKRASEILHLRLKSRSIHVKPDAIRARFRYHGRKLLGH